MGLSVLLTPPYEFPKAHIQDFPLGCDISSLSSNNPQHCSTVFNLPIYSVVAFLSLECPNFIFSGAKARSAVLCLWHVGSHRCLIGNQGMGREWVKNSSRTLPPLKLLHSSDLPRLSGAPTVPVLWETSGLLPRDKGVSQPLSHAAFFPAPARFTLSFLGSWALFLGSVAWRKGCLFSLFYFSV